MGMTKYRGHELNNLPALNVRNEFAIIRRDFADPATWSTLEAQPLNGRLAKIGGFFFGTGINDAITATYQRLFIGAESSLCFAFYSTGMFAAGLAPGLVADAVRFPMGGGTHYKPRPFTKGDKGKARVVISYYDNLPALIAPELALSAADPALSLEVHQLYKELRNPIFHGSQVTRCDKTDVDGVLGLFDRLYEWLDSWALSTADLLALVNGKTGGPTPG